MGSNNLSPRTRWRQNGRVRASHRRINRRVKPPSAQQHLTHFTFRVVRHPALVVEDHSTAAGWLERPPRQSEITNAALTRYSDQGRRGGTAAELRTSGQQFTQKVAAANTNPFGTTLAPSGWCLHRGYGHAVHASSVQHAILKMLQTQPHSFAVVQGKHLHRCPSNGRKAFD